MFEHGRAAREDIATYLNAHETGREGKELSA